VVLTSNGVTPGDAALPDLIRVQKSRKVETLRLKGKRAERPHLVTMEITVRP
jgi:hypothetical protein